MPRGFLHPYSGARFFFVLIAILGLSLVGMAMQDASLEQEPQDNQVDLDDQVTREKPEATGEDQCSQYTKPSISRSESGEMVKLDTLIEDQEQYYGKTVTVEGEMHRIFTDHVFTIEDDDFLRDDDVLIISDVPRAQAVDALEDSIEPGKDVRVTGFVHKYDKAQLECLYGPLNTESREGHSFTKSPVLIVQKLSEVATAAPEPVPAPLPEFEAAEPAPAPEPAELAPAEPAAELEPAAEPEAAATPEEADVDQQNDALPATASGIPMIGLLGLLSLASAAGVRYFRMR
jgi:hypothetical protein